MDTTVGQSPITIWSLRTRRSFFRVPAGSGGAGYPSVAPAGQFAVFNALAGPKELFVLTAGHHAYPAQNEENAELRRNLYNFFRDL